MTDQEPRPAFKAVLCAVNSRFNQTNPAVRSLAAYAASRLPETPLSLTVREYQTGQPVDAVARDLLGLAADFYAFSCYIWNRRAVFDIIAALRRMRPRAWIAIGGPEVSFDAVAILRQTPEIDFVISGEGEAPFAALLSSLLPDANPAAPTGNQPADTVRSDSPAAPAWSGIPGLAWRTDAPSHVPDALSPAPERTCDGWPARTGTGVRENPPADQPLDLSTLPFPYETDLAALGDRLLYYESSRGCPFRCSYCLSSVERSLRFRPLDQTLVQLDRFIAADVRLVKFVDRTFNCDPHRARAIWSHLIRRRQEQMFRTVFHFELAGDRLEPADLALLETAPAGLFQFEIGVQTIHPETLKRIRRPCDLPRLFANIRSLQASSRQHLHLDLIAGLPDETLTDVIDSFNALYRLGADQLQLGFLKLLPGTPILADIDRCGYQHAPFPPYEVLASRTLPAEALAHLHDIEAVLDSFANGGHFGHALGWLVPRFDSPYRFFARLAEMIARDGLKHLSLSIDQRAELLLQLAVERLTADEAGITAGLLRADHYRGGRKDAPGHLGALETATGTRQRAAVAELRRSRLPGVRIRVEAYPFSLSRLLASGAVEGEPEWVVYDLSGPVAVPVEALPAVDEP